MKMREMEVKLETERKQKGSKSGKSNGQNRQRKSETDILKIGKRRARELETNSGVDWKGKSAPKMESREARDRACE